MVLDKCYTILIGPLYDMFKLICINKQYFVILLDLNKHYSENYSICEA